MGNSRYDYAATRSYAASTAKRTTADYRSYAAPELDKKYDSRQVMARESAASVLNPNPTPIIVGVDGTGSMGYFAEKLRRGLGPMFSGIVNRKPVSDPHVLAAIIGDFECDDAPAQFTQFEADPVTLGKQIEELRIEGAGGGNSFEGYLGPVYFGLKKTKCDAFKQQRKGYIFTLGDELPQQKISSAHIRKFFGDGDEPTYTAADLYKLAEKNWHVFHLIVMEGSWASRNKTRVVDAWKQVLGPRAVSLDDHTKMAQVITGLIEVTAARDGADTWETAGDDVSAAVKDAVENAAPFVELDI